SHVGLPPLPSQVALDDKPGWSRSMVARAKPMLVDTDTWPLLIVGKDLSQGTHGWGEKELVDVKERDPARLSAVVFETMPDRARDHRDDEWPIVQDDSAVVQIRLGHFARIVDTLVVVKKEAFLPDKS